MLRTAGCYAEYENGRLHVGTNDRVPKEKESPEKESKEKSKKKGV